MQKISTSGQASVKNKWACWRPVYPYTWAIWQQSSYRHFAKCMNALEGATILDLGTGIGSYIPLLKLRPGTRMIFTDPDPIALARAQSIQSDSSNHFSFDVLDATGALEKYSAVTHVSMLHVYSVLPDPVGLLEQCHRQTPKACWRTRSSIPVTSFKCYPVLVNRMFILLKRHRCGKRPLLTCVIDYPNTQPKFAFF